VNLGLLRQSYFFQDTISKCETLPSSSAVAIGIVIVVDIARQVRRCLEDGLCRNKSSCRSQSDDAD
jgi:hypothetical protein